MIFSIVDLKEMVYICTSTRTSSTSSCSNVNEAENLPSAHPLYWYVHSVNILLHRSNLSMTIKKRNMHTRRTTLAKYFRQIFFHLSRRYAYADLDLYIFVNHQQINKSPSIHHRNPFLHCSSIEYFHIITNQKVYYFHR